VTGPTRILVVDDDAGLRKELRHLLEDAGYEVVAEAATGFQGVALARLALPDVVISDLRMPGDIGGLELAVELKGEIPVIVLSAYDDPGLQARVRGAGATFLVKGCRSRALFAAVELAASPGEDVVA
jgi:DNA-binding NarL/FixJ family response regulator